jgi:N-acyl homoserine lactone hydrolase
VQRADADGGMFNRPPTQPALLAGDLTYGADILQRGQLPGVGRRRQLSQSSRQVLALEAQQPGLVVLPAHDPTAAQRLLDS